ncbi:MAG: hypothetical protein IJT66_05480, partial [Clostridia bacterium]|nr:hypothetical protein [Clostridia bacterium]
KGSLDAEMADMMKRARKATKIMVSNANAYAAAQADHIIATPSFGSAYNSLDVEIPFYRMVFKGMVSMSVGAVNLSENPRTELLKAAETGCGLLYTVTSEYSSDFHLSDSAFAQSVYADNKEKITADCKELGEYLSAVSDACIKEHRILARGVNQTLFDNGITVIVNYTDHAVETSLGVVEPENFVYGKG